MCTIVLLASSPGTGQATKSFLIVASIPIKPVLVDSSPKQQLQTHNVLPRACVSFQSVQIFSPVHVNEATGRGTVNNSIHLGQVISKQKELRK